MRRSLGLKGFQPPRPTGQAMQAQPVSGTNQAGDLDENSNICNKLVVIGDITDLMDEERPAAKEPESTPKPLSFPPPSRPGTFIKPSTLPAREKPTSATASSDWPLCFNILFTKRSTKKRKTFSDGVLVIDRTTGKADLFDSAGKKVTSSRVRVDKDTVSMGQGSQIDLGGFEVEISSVVLYEHYLSGKVFLGGSAPSTSPRTFIPPTRPLINEQQTFTRPFELSKAEAPSDLPRKDGRSLGLSKSMAFAREEDVSNRIVLLQTIPRKEALGPVALDSFLAKTMRPHQVDGCRFLLECVTGVKVKGHQGCVLADEMGLGKTLQSIALVWLCLNQPRQAPICRKAVVVCPASLVGNWKKEFNKFLGPARLLPIAVTEGGEKQIDEFLLGRTRPLLIVSYETYRKFSERLNQRGGFDLLICDEGHRLKSASGNKTIDCLSNAPTLKRIILTGTPLQNQLDEFYSLINFVNPGVLGQDSKHFKRVFQNPIERGRDKHATKEEQLTAESRSKELFELTNGFVLRRTSDINAKLLPEKLELSVFVRLNEAQINTYQAFLQTERVADEEVVNGTEALRLISRLKQLCTGDSASQSSKLRFVHELVKQTLRQGERIVLVSNFTSILDLLEIVLNSSGIKFLRLDGSTKVNDRQPLVNRFNSQESHHPVFLLSSKAGGCGLNLIGANRLCLIDPDWNPAVDSQAMARVWRDGQTRKVFVYRVLATGTIEEKIFQRQLMKIETSRGIVSNVSSDGKAFSREELKQLFEFNGETRCETYEMVKNKWKPFESSNDLIGRDDVLKLVMDSLPGQVSFVHWESSLDLKQDDKAKIMADQENVIDSTDQGDGEEWDGEVFNSDEEEELFDEENMFGSDSEEEDQVSVKPKRARRVVSDDDDE